MTKPIDPYSRVYWRIAEDPRFAAIYPDERHLGTWLRLLMLADAMYPTAAPIPASTRPVSVKALVDAGLIELIPGGLYRVHGLAAERDRRSRAGTEPDPGGNREGPAPEPPRTAREPSRTLARAGVDETRRDEQRQAETRTAPALGIEDDESAVFAFLAQHGAAIRPDAPLGRRLLGLMERRGVETVIREAEDMATRESIRSDRQWVLGLENAIEAIPSGKEGHEQDVTEEANARNDAMWDRTMTRRMDWFRNTGQWPEGWGPAPKAEGSVA